MIASASPSFIAALHSDRPAADRTQKMGLYGWLIGRWEMDCVIHDDDGRAHTGRGEIHFGWVLEGRAIQDVWILPGFFYGTTLRVYDPDMAPGTSSGATRSNSAAAARSAAPMAMISCRRAMTTPVPRCAGASPRSRPPHSVGAANTRP